VIGEAQRVEAKLQGFLAIEFHVDAAIGKIAVRVEIRVNHILNINPANLVIAPDIPKN
jgi:hypothetical protein